MNLPRQYGMKCSATVSQFTSSNGGAFINVGNPGKTDLDSNYLRGVSLWGHASETSHTRTVVYIGPSNTFCFAVFDDDQARLEWEESNPEFKLEWKR